MSKPMLRKRMISSLLALAALASLLGWRNSTQAATPPPRDFVYDDYPLAPGYTYWPLNAHRLTSAQWQRYADLVARQAPLILSAPAFMSNPPLATVRPDATTIPQATDNGAAQRQVQVPILMYHYISAPPDATDRLRAGLSVTPEILDQHLDMLRREGWNTISLYEMHDHLNSGAPLPPKPIVLTFDDGYLDNYASAFPLLKKHRATATFFIVTDFVGVNPGYMTWRQVQEMSEAGMSIENHTRNHPDLRNRDRDYLVWQVLGPIEAITAYTGKRPRFFAYPAGQFDVGIVRLLESAGTWGAVTTQPGMRHQLGNSLTWTRVRVIGNMSADELARAIGP